MLKYLKKYWLFAILAPLFMVGEVLADLVQPRLMSAIVDEGVLGLSNNGVGNLNLVLTEGLKMIIFVILGGLSGILCGVCANIASQNFGNDLRKDIFKNIPDIREKVEIGDIVIGVWYPEGTFLLEIENLYEHGDGEIVLGACDNNSDYEKQFTPNRL